MSRPSPAPAPRTKSLAQQQSDFTSEGAPPPGEAATQGAAVEETPVTTLNCALVAAPGPVADPSGKRRARQVAVAALLALPLVASAANILASDCFEGATQGAGNWSPRHNLAEWAGGRHGIESRFDVAGAAYAGVNHVEFDATHDSRTFHQVGILPGEVLGLSLVHAPREGAAERSAGIALLSDDLSRGASTGNGVHRGSGWTAETLAVTGAADMSTLLSRAVGKDDSHGGSLDRVASTRTVSEPGTLALAFAALGAAGLVVRRRRFDPDRR